MSTTKPTVVNNKANLFHNHHNIEEMFFVIEVRGVLRFGDKEYEIRKHDVIVCPAGKREVAHQIIMERKKMYLKCPTGYLVELKSYG